MVWWLIGLAGALVVWGLWAVVCPRLLVNPRGDVLTGFAYYATKWYVRVVHRLRVEGAEHVPRWRPGDPAPGPLVVVSNHVSGADPLLLQSAAVFEIRWMMMREMMLPSFKGVWEWAGVIPVGGEVSGAQTARAAIKYLQGGGVVGVFPQGGIERPGEPALGFEPGVGLLVSKAHAKVLLAVIDGVPAAKTAYESLFKRSHARVRFVGLLSYEGSGLGPTEIAQDLERRMRESMGQQRA